MDENSLIPIDDTRLENALNAYVFVLKNTLNTFAEAGYKLDDDVDADEVIKAACNISFKYLSMETEITRMKEA